MTAEYYATPLATPLMPPPRRLHTGRARQSKRARPRMRGEEPLPAHVCGSGHGSGRPKMVPPAQTGRRYPQGPAGAGQGTRSRQAARRGAAVPNQRSAAVLSRRRAAARARRRLAALLMLAGLFTGLLALRGLAPGTAGAGTDAGQAPAGDAARVVTLMLQQPALPNGCETVSMAMLLDQAGCPIDPVELFGGYLPHEPFQYMGNERYGPDPETAYAGDAASERNGWYCFEGPVVEGANAYLSAYKTGRQARAVSGLDQEELAEYLDAGRPLAVWVTRGYEPPRTSSFRWILPNGSRYAPYANLHCVVLAGRQEDGQYRIADPLEGWQTVDPETFWQSFDAMGRRAVVVG